MKSDIAKLVAGGFHANALSLYAQQHSASVRPHKFTFPPLLKACAKLEWRTLGKILHGQLIKSGFQTDVYAATALTDMYMKVRITADAIKAFDEMPEKNLASLNAVICGLSLNGCSREAFSTFRKVRDGTLRPNSVTIASLLSACGSIENGIEIHCWAIKLGVEQDVYVSTSLLNLYSNCEDLILASKVFAEMPDKNLVSYNAYISGLLQNGMALAALDVFKSMRKCSDWEPNSVTISTVLSACSRLLHICFGQQVHGLVIKLEIRDVMVGTALVDVYSKCGAWQCAYNIFKELEGIRNLFTWNSMIDGMMLNNQSETATALFETLESEGLKPDSTTWNSMISGFSRLGKAVEAFDCFNRMQSTGIVPSVKLITSLLPACVDLSALLRGKEIHVLVIKTLAGIDELMATALMDMYMKCGHPVWGRRVFDHFEPKPDDRAFWNAMISGYGRNGDHESAFEIFDRMLEEKVRPNAGTFSCVLSVCSHAGLVDKGWLVFRMMVREYGLQPNLGHYACMVDLLGRCGELQKARELVEELPETSTSILSSLLGACRCHLNSELGEEMALKILKLEPGNPTPFVILSNIYAGLGRWKDAERIRRIMNDRGLRKPPGSSSVELT